MRVNAKDIRSQLRRHLRQTGKMQYELAADLGTTPNAVHRWLSGKSRVSKAYQRLLIHAGILRFRS